MFTTLRESHPVTGTAILFADNNIFVLSAMNHSLADYDSVTIQRKCEDEFDGE
jgi:hypothetical protein